MKSLKDWNEDLDLTKMDMVNWANNVQNSWKAHLTFLGLLSFLLLLSILLQYVLGYYAFFITTRVMALLLGLQVIRIIVEKFKEWWGKRKNGRSR